MYQDGVGYGLWCLWFVGLAGVHRIYLGRYGTGILWMLTFGLFGVGQLVDLFRMKELVRGANIREGHLPHPRYRAALPDRAPEDVDPPPPTRGAWPAGPNRMQRLLEAARENGGAISVTEGVAATGLSFREVEETLTAMLESGYVDVENAPDSGVVLYRFTELR